MYAMAQKATDAVGVHPSGFNNPPDDDLSTNSTPNSNFKGHWSFYSELRELWNVMVNNGDSGKKLWFKSSAAAAQARAASRPVRLCDAAQRSLQANTRSGL
jgi:hypothetical protein